jgi:hypothetical protein
MLSVTSFTATPAHGSKCRVTLTSDPKVPRLDWFVGWGLDFKNTMNEFIGKENFKIECEAESEDILIGRELKWE